MANGYFERGEIYFVRTDGGIGSEEGTFRPGVILSNSEVNCKCSTVVVCYMTSQPRNMSIYKDTWATGKRSWILTNQVATVDKVRLNKMIGVLNDSEIKWLNGALEEVFNLGYVDDTKDDEIAALKAQIAEMETKIAELLATHEKETLTHRVEKSVLERCYERALDMLAQRKVAADMAVVEEKPQEPAVKVPVVEEEPEKVEPEKVELVDINSATITALKKVGFPLAMAKRVVGCRPFTSVSDLKRVPGLESNLYRILEPKLCCVAVEAEEQPEQQKKLNVNTATAREIAEWLGIHLNSAYAITGKRSREGNFTSLDQIVVGARFSANMLEKYRDKLTV